MKMKPPAQRAAIAVRLLTREPGPSWLKHEWMEQELVRLEQAAESQPFPRVVLSWWRTYWPSAGQRRCAERQIEIAHQQARHLESLRSMEPLTERIGRIMPGSRLLDRIKG